MHTAIISTACFTICITMALTGCARTHRFETGPSQTTVVEMLAWGEIKSGQEIERVEDVLTKAGATATHEGDYTYYTIAYGPFSQVLLVALNNRLVTAETVGDMGPITVFFDQDPATASHRLLMLQIQREEVSEQIRSQSERQGG